MTKITSIFDRIKTLFLLLVVMSIASGATNLTCSDGYTKYLNNIFTSGSNTSTNLVSNLFELDADIIEFDVEKIWTYDGDEQLQDKEQFKLLFTDADDTVLAETKYTNDIDNTAGSVGNTQFTNLGTTVLPLGKKWLKLVHRASAQYADNLNYANSVKFKGLCYKATKAPKPTGAKCYALTDNSPDLHEFFVNPDTNPLPSPYIQKVDRTFNGEGSAYRASDKKVYSFQNNGTFSDLYSIEVETGKSEKVVSKLLESDVDGAAFYIERTTNREVLYILAGQDKSKLYAFYVDNWTSVNTYPKKVMGMSDLDSLAIDRNTGKAYSIDDYNYNDKAPKLYELDLLSAEATYKFTLAEV
ncbi:MAG: Unknown protein, partial [uncultured Sulfurovum sp.]